MYGNYNYGQGYPSAPQGYPAQYPNQPQAYPRPANPMAGATPAYNAYQPQQGYPAYPAQPGQPYKYPQPGYPGVPNSGPYAAPAPYPGATAPAPPYGGPTKSAGPSPVGYPTVQPLKYKVPEHHKDKYANLYGIIAAVEALQTELIEGHVSQADYDRLFEDLKRPFDVITRALGLTKDMITSFCDSVSLSSSFALLALYQDPEASAPQSKQLSKSEVAQVVVDIVTLSNMCQLGNIKVSYINDQFKKIVRAFKQTSLLQDNPELSGIVNKWTGKLNEADPESILDAKALKELGSDIETANGIFNNALNE